MVKKIFAQTYLWILLLLLYSPIVIIVIYSFTEAKVLGNWTGFSTKLYTSLFTGGVQRSLVGALWNTFAIAMLAASISTILGSIAAIGIFNLRSRSRRIMNFGNAIPMMNADIITGVSLFLLFVSFGISQGFTTVVLAHISFCTPYVVLSDINASFENGKTNLIIGQSGSGKTVLMKCIVGLLTPEKGEVLYDGRNLVLMGKKEKKMLRKEMGMIFQSAALFDSMTVLDNVMFPLNMFSNDTLRERTKRAMFCLDRVNLGEAKDKFPGEISGGMQKRVAIARAIALNPQYLFCDEPNSGLDPKTSLVIDDLIHDITQEYNMTTIINTHDMNSVLGIGEKVIYIYEGHKEWEGTKDDIFTSTNERLNNFIFASDLLRKVKDVEVQGMEG